MFNDPNRPLTLVFDLDGTLADTAPDIIGTLNTLLAADQLGPVPLEAARELVGSGARALLEMGYAAHGQRLTPERLDTLFTQFIEHYEARICQETYVFEGVKDALERQITAGHRLAVCTNKGERQARLVLKELNIETFFKAICGGDTFARRKPDASHLLGTIEKAGGHPARAIMIGDSQTDILTARAAGIPVIAVPFGYTPESIETYEPDDIMHHFDDLDKKIANMTQRLAAL